MKNNLCKLYVLTLILFKNIFLNIKNKIKLVFFYNFKKNVKSMKLYFIKLVLLVKKIIYFCESYVNIISNWNSYKFNLSIFKNIRKKWHLQN